MANGQVYLVVGYNGGAVARVAFDDQQKAEEARRHLLEAMTTPVPSGRSAYVNVTAQASMLAEHVVFAYVADAEVTYYSRLS